MKTCCEQQGYNCYQGRDCPVRVCRQRAGKPADYTIFTSTDSVADLEAECERQAKSDLKAILFIASCVLAFFLVVWGTL